MKRYSSSYVYERSNFVLIGIEEQVSLGTEWSQYACVALNIIQRGTPTPPSKSLEDALGSAICLKGARGICKDFAQKPSWSPRTIKGSPDGKFNPALKLYSDLLPKALPEDQQYILSYVLPEALIADMVDGCEERFVEQRVDFYCPRAKLVIEVDGSQHNERQQKFLDRERDKYLERNGIEVLRMGANELDAKKASQELISRFAQDESDDSLDDQKRPTVYSYEIAMRVQVAVLECIRAGVLDPSSPSWEISMIHDQQGLDGNLVLKESVNEVLDLLENLCSLSGREFRRPTIAIKDQASDLCLDVSATRMWSELEGSDGVVYARNDYYEDKENFTVSCDEPIIYDSTSPERYEKIEGALKFFLNYLFGYDKFRAGQAGIVKKALTRIATIGILPTGSGKSLCYQMACLLQPCISFVVCPIISLIQDQELNARKAGICRVGRVDSQMDRDEKNAVLARYGQLGYQLVWISPERFQTKDFRAQLQEIGGCSQFGYAVIDEVHCLSEWGHDFRVSYLKLHDAIKKCCPGAVTLGLTATASRNVLADLLVELEIPKQNVQTSPSLDRSELTYHIVKTSEAGREETLGRVLDEIDETFQRREGVKTVFEVAEDDSICGIVFSNTKSNGRQPITGCEGVAAMLKDRGISADTYHAGRGDERSDIQQAFLDNEFTVMAATKAFGMGVNKKNVRYTIHNGLPWSIEAFYQEAGRAGRDSEKNESECYIVYSNESDRQYVEKVFARESSISDVRSASSKLSGDLGTLFFLWCRNHEELDAECNAIVSVFGELSRRRDGNGIAVIGFDFVKKRYPKLYVNTQDVLYKLALLGIVKDWTVEYNSKTYEVLVREIDANSEVFVRESLERYIERHSPSFSFSSTNPAYRPYVDAYKNAPEGKKLIGLINALLLWTNDKIVFSRREAIHNILRLCEKNMSEQDIRTYINDFFKLDTENNDQLEVIVHTLDDVDTWERIFKTYELTDDPEVQHEVLKGQADIEEISALCDRYRESFQGNIGLEWTTLVARLLSARREAKEVSETYAFLAHNVRGYVGLDAEALFNRTLTLVKNASEEAKDDFGAAVVTHTPHRAQQTYEELGDNSTLEYLVTTAAAMLRNKWGRSGR